MPDTQVDEQQLVEQDQTQEGSETQGTEGNDEYFLTVDDRTKYRTAEDAQKAYQEAGQRIAELSQWEKEIGKTYGANPQQIAAALDDYIKIKAEQEKQAAADQGKTAGAQATHTDDVQLTPKEQEALKWLKKIGPQLGYVPKSELDEVKNALQELRNGQQSENEARLEGQIATGQGTLNSLIASNKLSTDPKFAKFVENSVAAWVNESVERQKTWHRGGAAAQELLKEGFAYVMSDGINFIRGGASQTTRQGSNTGTRTGNLKRLPQVGAALGQKTNSQQQQKSKPSAKDIHEAAWAAANKKWTGTSGDGGE